MIEFRKLTKTFRLHGRRKTICEGLNLRVPSRRSVALLGRNGAGKTTLLRMISGAMEPTSGTILSTGSVSWPVGFAGSFHGDLTGAQNARFIARIYGRDSIDMASFVEDFAELGPSYHLPFRVYSAGMKARLAFGVSMAIPFDTYLVDEVTSVGDAAFRQKSSALFKDRMRYAGAFVVSHNMDTLSELCDAGLVLEQGRVVFHDTVDAAIDHHRANMQRSGAVIAG